MRKRFVLTALALALLTLAFWGVGAALHFACAGKPVTHFGWVSIAGYDSEGYLNAFCNIRHLFSGSFRHPLMMFESIPMFVMGGLFVKRLGPEVAKMAILLVFALIGALGCLFQYLIARRLQVGRLALVSGLCLWTSFAHVWIVGGLAESFGPSQLFLLGTVLMVVSGVRNWRAWAVLSVASGGMTLTNGVKPVLAWLVGVDRKDVSARTLLKIALCGLGLASLGSLALVLKWILVDGLGIAEAAGTIVRDITACLPADFSWMQRLGLVWQSFWCEPMMLHGSVLASDGPTADYATVLPHLLAGLILILCIVSAVLNFKRPVVRVLLAMVSVDFLLHVVIGWGIAEGQIYCAHWFWCIPILVELLPGRLAAVGIPLAFALAAHNLLTVLSLLR